MFRETPECQLERRAYRLKRAFRETPECQLERRAYRLKHTFRETRECQLERRAYMLIRAKNARSVRLGSAPSG